MRKSVIMTGMLLLVGCEKFRTSSELDLDPIVRQHFDFATRDPSTLQFRNLRKLADGRVCGEVNYKNTKGEYLGFASFLDTMKPLDEPIIARPDAVIGDPTPVLNTCMDDLQRKKFAADVAIASSVFERDMQRKSDETSVQLLKAQLRSKELDQEELRRRYAAP